jgi:guanylate kinase
MLIVLVGESGSGKSRIQYELIKNGLQKVVTYTTRPIRSDEINHVDYHFVTEKEFKRELLDKNLLLEYAIYNDWHYGFSLEGINYHDNDYVIVLTPNGLLTLRKKIGEKDVLSIYLNVHERERLLRLTKRGDNIDEIFRRIQSDRIDFKGVHHMTDMVVNEREIETLVPRLLAITKRGVQG